MHNCPQAAPGPRIQLPGPGVSPSLRHPPRYNPAGLCFSPVSIARRMTQASFNLRIFLILLWFAATPAFPSSRILFPLHRLRHVEPIEEEPHTRKVQKIADHNIFRKPSSGAVRFPRSVKTDLENFRTPHSNMKILVGDSSGQTPTQISAIL